MDDSAQQPNNYIDMSVAGPVKYVTKPVNRLLLRSLIVLPFLLVIGFPAYIIALLFFSLDLAFLIAVVAFGIPIGLFFFWAVSSMILVSLFGATCKAKSMAMFLLMMAIWPVCFAISLADTLPILLIPHDFAVYVFISITIGAYVFGFWWVFIIPDDTVNPVPIKVHAQSILFVLVLLVSVSEIFYPYPETVITDVVFDECEVKKYRSKRSALTESSTICRARFEENGVGRTFYLSRGKDEVVRIRHGLVNHYRSNVSE